MSDMFSMEQFLQLASFTENMKASKAAMGFEVSLPAGRYYIGDICYVLDDEVYYGVWDNAGFAEGLYEANGGIFAVAMTAHGDGCYSDSNGNCYGVDAGNIGIVSENLCKKFFAGLKIIEFKNKVTFACKLGKFTITDGDTNIVIDSS